jgi:hypothetical protein
LWLLACFVFYVRHGPVCFEKLEAFNDLKELDGIPMGAVKYSVKHRSSGFEGVDC